MTYSRNKFSSKERLKSHKDIEQLFEEGNSFLCYPVKVVWMREEAGASPAVRAGFSVSKKTFRKATERNAIKRKMKEAYRLNKQILNDAMSEKKIKCMFIYIARENLLYGPVEKGITRALGRLSHIV